MQLQWQQSTHPPVSGQAVTLALADQEKLHMLHPGQIIAYDGPSNGRHDRLMDVKGMYRKRNLIRADFTGPCRFVTSLPPGFNLIPITIEPGSDLLYDFRHLFYYTEGITMQTRLLKLKNILITRDVVKVKFGGQGEIGLLTQGTVMEMKLHPSEPIYVDARSLLAYPENAALKLSVYGNHLASQHMRYQWAITGSGSILIQSGHDNGELEQHLNDDSLFRRILREVIPFGGIFIK
ncbi:AIM24 family protein [Paenibacillus dauci]|uniref:AIM24 family protein n=1 Tax=Paenibacillus dauci TaxID=1567106 RepID=UPI0009E2CA9E